MPTIKVITVKDAPPPPRKLTEETKTILDALNALKKDELLQLEPDEGKTVRGLKTSVGRIASNAGLKVESYSVDDVVYVKKL